MSEQIRSRYSNIPQEDWDRIFGKKAESTPEAVKELRFVVVTKHPFREYYFFTLAGARTYRDGELKGLGEIKDVHTREVIE